MLSEELKLKNTNSQWLPQLNLNGQATYQSDVTSIPLKVPGLTALPKDQYKANVDINQVIYDGGSIKAQNQINRVSANADLQQIETEMQKVKEQVNLVFFNLILIKQNRAILESLQNTITDRFKTVQTGVKNGLLQQNDQDVLQVELIKNAEQINELDISYQYGIKTLSELTGRDVAINAQMKAPEINLQISDSITRPELKQLELQQSTLDFSEKLTGSQRIPKLYAFSQAGYGRPGLNMLSSDFETFYIVGVTLKWNIWDWSKTSHDRQLLMIQKDMLGTRREAFIKSIRIALNNSESHIRQLEKSLEADSAMVELRKGIADRSAVRLENGVISASDYVNDVNASAQSKLQFEFHKVQLIQEKVNYMTLKGKM
jgi:outer membrane protein TolC